MAIYQGENQLHPKKDGTLLERKYYKEREEIRDLFNKFKKGDEPASLTFTRDFEKKYNRSGTSYLAPAPQSVPLKAIYSDADIDSVEIRYSQVPPVKENGRIRWIRPILMMDEFMSVNENQMDLAWFLLKMSGLFKTGTIKLVDQEVRIDAEYDSIMVQADISRALLAEDRTADELEQIFDLFGEGKYAYNKEESVRTNAVSLWKIVIARDKAGETQVLPSLKSVIDLIIKPTVKASEGNVMVGGKEFPILPLPEGWKKKEILLEAENNGIELPKNPLKLDALYSILQAKLSILQEQS